MGLVRAFFRDKTPPRILMLAALLLLTLSQFFAYFEAPGSALSGRLRETASGQGLWSGLPVTGWELHPQALPILALLALAFLLDDVADHLLLRRFGYGLALVLMLAAMSPGAPTRAVGASMGGIAFLMGLVAAVWHQLLPRMVAPPIVPRVPPER